MVFLDQTFAAVVALGVVPCTAAGTNLITLSPASNTPTISAYANYLLFSFVALHTTTGSVTLQVGSLPALPVYAADGTIQLGSGAIVINDFYVVAFNQALNSGNGGWTVVSASATGVAAGSYVGKNNTFTFDASGRLTTLSSSAATGVIQQQIFTGSGTFSTPSGTGLSTVYKLTVVAGGGGGGGANNGAGNAQASGGAGAAAAIAWFSGLTPGSSIVVTVGGAGTAGAGTGVTGGTGGTSSISGSGILSVVALGGVGGASAGSGSASGTSPSVGGTATGGTINLVGGGGGGTSGVGGGTALGGQGGNSLFGGGGSGGFGTAGQAGGAPGAGGGGGGVANSGNAGGAGAAGIVIAEWVQ
jgi:hypothetical protein